MDGNILGVDDGLALGKKLDTVDGVVDGSALIDGILDNDKLGAPEGVQLGVTEGAIDGSKLGADDGSVLGLLLIDGMEDGPVLGTNDWQVRHVALHVWKKPNILQLIALATAHVVVVTTPSR